VAVGIASVLAVVITIVAARARLRTTGQVSAEVMHTARVRLFAHLQRLSLDFYTGEKAGVIMFADDERHREPPAADAGGARSSSPCRASRCSS
jgi:hypothetical protein